MNDDPHLSARDRGAREALRAPHMQALMREMYLRQNGGLAVKPTGIIVDAEQARAIEEGSAKLLPFAKPAAPPEEPTEYIVPKRVAKSTAEEIAKRKCRLTNGVAGRVEIHFDDLNLVFTGRTWFLALLGVKNHFDPVPRQDPPSEPAAHQ